MVEGRAGCRRRARGFLGTFYGPKVVITLRLAARAQGWDTIAVSTREDRRVDPAVCSAPPRTRWRETRGGWHTWVQQEENPTTRSVRHGHPCGAGGQFCAHRAEPHPPRLYRHPRTKAGLDEAPANSHVRFHTARHTFNPRRAPLWPCS